MPGLELGVASTKFFAMGAVCGRVKILWTLAMTLNALILSRLSCHGAQLEYCPVRTCGAGNQAVEIRYPFLTMDDAATGRCYSDYPQLEFMCVRQGLYLDFPRNATYSKDMNRVTKIDYWNQTLSLTAQGTGSYLPTLRRKQVWRSGSHEYLHTASGLSQ